MGRLLPVRTAMPLAIVLLLSMLAAGCSSKEPPRLSDSAASAPTVTPAASSTNSGTQNPSFAPTTDSATSGSMTAEAARRAAVTAYLGMWADFATAAHTSDWQSPLLAQHATAYALQVMEKSLYTDHQDGVITKGAPVDQPVVKSVSPAADPSIVLISDCGDSSHTRKYVLKTGKPAPGGAGGRQKIIAEVRRQIDGSWKVDQFAVEAVGSC